MPPPPGFNAMMAAMEVLTPINRGVTLPVEVHHLNPLLKRDIPPTFRLELGSQSHRLVAIQGGVVINGDVAPFGEPSFLSIGDSQYQSFCDFEDPDDPNSELNMSVSRLIPVEDYVEKDNPGLDAMLPFEEEEEEEEEGEVEGEEDEPGEGEGDGEDDDEDAILAEEHKPQTA